MLEKINNFVESESKPIALHFPNDLVVSIKPFLSIKDEVDFTTDVIENSYVDGSYFPILSKTAFAVAFIKHFTDIPMETKVESDVNGEEITVVDSEKMYRIFCGLDIIDMLKSEYPSIYNYVCRLKENIYETVDFRNKLIIANNSASNASDYAINSFGDACGSAIKILETINTFLENNGEKVIEKILGAISSENLDKLAELLPDDAKDLADILGKSPAN